MLPDEQWLPYARRLAVGMRDRIFHLGERRKNLAIGNERDRWWAYCQACKTGAVRDKEHVLLGPATALAAPPSLAVPPDRAKVLGSEFEVPVGRFLASKGMDYAYLPELWFSESDRRLLLVDEFGHWHGRDLTDRSPAKWLHYGAKFVGKPLAITVLTEDIFSMYKVRHAARYMPNHAVCCTLGAGIHDAAVLALKSVKCLLWAYDGDAAGDEGFKEGSKRMRPFVQHQQRCRPPEGMDPKDMTIEQIQEMIR